MALVALVGCAGADERRAGSTPAEPVASDAPRAGAPAVMDAGVASTPADATPTAPTRATRATRIELTFVGDLMFGGYFDDHYDPQLVEKHDPLVEMDALLASDLAFGNLETTITRTLPNAGGPHDGKGHKRFVTLPERVAVLPRHRLATVTLANNHQLDNDDKGLVETVEILRELGIAYVGAARAEAPRFRVETVDVKGWRVGFVAATTVMNRGQRKGGPMLAFAASTALRTELVPVIESARSGHELVVVAVHWGAEYEDAPARWQIDAAHAFVEAGADLVIGHHPHVLQGIERYKGGLIAYSLGNFVFPNGKERIRDTGVLRVGFAERGPRACLELVAFQPAIQIRTPITHPVIPKPAQRDAIAKRLFALSAAPPLATKWRLDGERFVTDAACAP